jgi:hypothetical protein
LQASSFRKRFSHNWFLSNWFDALRPQMSLSHLACLLAFALVPLVSAQTIIHVPGDQKTIQAGINAANNGDTVLVAAGTYYENINFNGKAITVISASGAATTIIDGSKGNKPAVFFITGEPRAAVLSSFTIQGGGVEPDTSNQTGGILYQNNAQASLVNDIITQNHCYGVWAQVSSPLIQNTNVNNTLDTTNGCSPAGGAAIFLQGSAVDSSGNYIASVVSGNTLENNTESGLEDAGGNGGAGIAIWGGNPIIENNIIRNNHTHDGIGGAIYELIIDSNGGPTMIVQNLIYDNQAGGGGGALGFSGALGVPRLFIANNTIVDNTYSNETGSSNDYAVSQIYAGESGTDGPDALFVNNIIVGNTALPAIQCGWGNSALDAAYQPIFDHNLLLNSGGPIFAPACLDTSTQYGNISADPKFANQSGNDYHLQSGSPAFDAGNTSILQSLADNGLNITTDFDGNPRVTDATGQGYPIIDMGAYEYTGVQDAQPTTIVLTPSEYALDAGTQLSLTAQLVSAAGTPNGSVAFLEDGNQIGTAQIDSTGRAVLPSPPLVPGVHSFIAIYPAPSTTNSTLPPARSVVVIVLAQVYSSTLTLNSTPNPSQSGASVTFSLNLSAPDGIPTGTVTLTDISSNTLLATLTPDSKGNATFSTSSLPLGTNLVQAAYAGDTAHASASAEVNQVVGALNPAALQPLSSPNPSAAGQAVTFKAIVTSTSGTPTGSVTFLDGTTTLGSAPLVNGTATFTTSSLAAGTHTILMDYPPNSTWFGVEEPLTQTVTALPTTTAIAAAPNPAYALQVVTVEAKVTTTASGTPTGSVTFYDAGAPIGTTVLQPNGIATLFPSFTTAATHQLTAVYSGDTSFSSSTSSALPEIIQLNPTATVITSIVPSQVQSFATTTLTAKVSSTTGPIFSATGTVTFSIGGTVLGTAALANGTATLQITSGAPGRYPVIATYSGDTAFAKSASPSQTLTVIPDVVSVMLISSEYPSIFGDSVTFTASIVTATTPAASGPPLTGTFTFFDGTTQLGKPVQASTTGTATYTTSTLAVGTHPITAVFSGNADVAGATSPVTDQVVQAYPGTFTLSITPDNAAIYTGAETFFNITATPENGFNLPLGLTCSSLPANTACVFGPARIVANPPPGSEFYLPYASTLTIKTVAPSPKTSAASLKARWTGGAAALACLCGILIVPRRVRRALRMRLVLIGVILIGVFAAISGCSGGGTLTGGTPPGTYQINITAQTPGGGPQLSQVVSIKLVVKSLF